MKIYYELLGITQKATEQQIRDAYRATALLCHPDHGGNQVLFDLVKTVSDILLDTKFRNIYNGFQSEEALLAYNDKAESDEQQFPIQEKIITACNELNLARQEKMAGQQNEIKKKQKNNALQMIQAIFLKKEDLIYLELFDWMIKLSDISELAPRSSELQLIDRYEKIYRATKLLALAVKPEGVKTVQAALIFLENEKKEIAKKQARGVLLLEDFQIDALVLWAAETYYSSLVDKKTNLSSKDLIMSLFNQAQNTKNQIILIGSVNFYEIRSFLISEPAITQCYNASISLSLFMMAYLEKFRESVTDVEQEKMIDEDTTHLACSLLKIAKNQPDRINIILKQLINAQNKQTLFIQQLYRKLARPFFDETGSRKNNSPQKHSALTLVLDELGILFFCEQKSMWPFFIEMRSKNLLIFERSTQPIIQKPLTPEWLFVVCECNEPNVLRQILEYHVNQEKAKPHFETLLFDLMVQYKDTPRKIVWVIQTILPFLGDKIYLDYKNTLILASQYLEVCLSEEQAENTQTAIVFAKKETVKNSLLAAPSSIFFEEAELLQDVKTVLSRLLFKTDNALIWKGFLNRFDLKSCIQVLFELERKEEILWNVRNFLIQALSESFKKNTVNPELLNWVSQKENLALLNKMLVSLPLDENQKALKENLAFILKNIEKRLQVIEQPPVLEQAQSLPTTKTVSIFSGMSSLFKRSKSDSPRMHASVKNSTSTEREDVKASQDIRNIHDKNTEKYGDINQIDEGVYLQKSFK